MKRLENRKLLILSVVLVAMLLLSISFATFSDNLNNVVSTYRPTSLEGKPQISLTTNKLSDNNNRNKIVLFPKNFPISDPDLEDFFYSEFNVKKNKFRKAKILRFDGGEEKTNAVSSIVMNPDKYHSQTVNVFGGHRDIEQDQCKDIQKDVEVQVTDMKSMDTDLENIIKQFKKEKSDLYKQMEPYFKDDIDKQFEEKTIGKHWYRLAGTSVWLAQYGVHFMISRIIYSPNGHRNQPNFSLTYGQIFDEKWKELKDIDMIIPTNDPDSIHDQVNVNGQFFTKVHYPGFLPMPTYSNPERRDGKYYGPEDPRLLLVVNELGYEEPLIIFNAYHRKITEKEDVDEKTSTLHFDYYRSMFMCFPWQFQRGQTTMNQLPNKATDKMIFNRAIELRRSGIKRLPVQKNWTPFTDFLERQTFKHDRFIYFVYRWASLEILKCELTGTIGSTSNCEFVYKMDQELPLDTPVGALRGGTEMININAFVDEYNLNDLVELPENKEFLVGFARAHLKNCGCGQDIYRPNLVLIVKDNNSKTYKIEMVSSFVSLGVDTIGWNLEKPKEICTDGEPNVFIPNGISSWSVRDNDDSFEDYLTLSFSLSDATVDIIHVKNVLKAVIETYEDSNNGFNNNNVDCALAGSTQFCKTLGDKVKSEKEKSKEAEKGS